VVNSGLDVLAGIQNLKVFPVYLDPPSPILQTSLNPKNPSIV